MLGIILISKVRLFITLKKILSKVILDVTSNMAAVEVGGGPWFSTWKGKTNPPEIVKRVVGLPIDVEGFFSLAPFLKPPGL